MVSTAVINKTLTFTVSNLENRVWCFLQAGIELAPLPHPVAVKVRHRRARAQRARELHREKISRLRRPRGERKAARAIADEQVVGAAKVGDEEIEYAVAGEVVV